MKLGDALEVERDAKREELHGMIKQSKDKYAMLTDVAEQAKAGGGAPSGSCTTTFFRARRRDFPLRRAPQGGMSRKTGFSTTFGIISVKLGHAEALADYLNVTDRSAHPKSTCRPVCCAAFQCFPPPSAPAR